MHEHIIFLGKVYGTESLVRTSDIVVVPSIWGDACPSTVSEALAAGKPLIATRVGGVPELIGDDGAAIMIEPGNSLQLAESLASLIKNPVRRTLLSIYARQRAEKALDNKRYYSEVLYQLMLDIGLTSHNR